jgi:predicted ATPase
MAIHSITAKNFTVFNDIHIDLCGGVNVFIGENGTGKTHLLKLLYTASLVRSGNHERIAGIFGEDFDFAFDLTQTVTDKTTLTNGDSAEVGYTVNGKAVLSPEQLEQPSDAMNKSEDPESFPSVKVISDMPIAAIYLPAKDMLTHGRLEKDYGERYLPFDTTLIDILNKAGVSTKRTLEPCQSAVMDKIASIIGGKVVYKNPRYYVQKENGMLIGFDMEAEGYKKFGLIYRLIETGYLEKGSTILWDEPEANLNPKMIPEIVSILLALSRHGVQVFLATHDYNLMKYFSIAKKARDEMTFYSLYKTDYGVACEAADDYDFLDNNVIVDAEIKLLEDEIGGVF